MSPLPGGITLCDPMWHVSSRSGVATLRTAIHLLLTYLLTYPPPVKSSPASSMWIYTTGLRLQLTKLVLPTSAKTEDGRPECTAGTAATAS